MRQSAHGNFVRFGIAVLMLCSAGHARAEVISYTLGIHLNCPYGLAR